jgi:hypothetical protein
MSQSIKLTQQLSRTVVQLQLARPTQSAKEPKPALATGFFWKFGDTLYLISNWHNFAGRNPLDGKPLSSTAFEATHVRFHLGILQSSEGSNQQIWFKPIEMPLYEDGVPLWLEHASERKRVDVAALKIAKIDCELFSLPINTFEDFVDFEAAASDDVFVLGFPLGISFHKYLPIWKRGSIASEPKMPINGLEMVYIDTATREGMSGAPVFVRQSGLIRPKVILSIPQEEKSIQNDDVIGTAFNFLGIYSGRVGADELGAQLGIVWKRNLIEQVVTGGVRGEV